MKTFKTIILAAGKGVRMKSDLPKVLHPVCGKPIIEYVLDIAKSLGSLKIYVVLGHKSEAVRKYLRRDVVVVIQKKLLGTADAVKSAQHYFRGDKNDVLILSGDTPLLNKETIQSLLKRHRETKAACTFLTADVCNPQGYGRIIRSESGSVVAIREEMDTMAEEKEINEINVGAYCFRSTNLFQTIKEIKANEKKKEFYLTDIIGLLVDQGALIETVKTNDFKEGLGINTREDLAFAQSVLRRRILKNLMLQGVTIEDPDTTYIDSDVRIGRDTTIRPFTVIEEDVHIGDRCVIGPFCRIRPHSRIGNGIVLGNFTEVSRSTIGDETFMKHFSFLGDAIVGRRVNIGAGVVTANFDGKRKNITKILDGAFVGSDSILVAPVKIGKKATTGAGCVVTKGTTIPDGGVVVGVPARIQSRRKSI